MFVGNPNTGKSTLFNALTGSLVQTSNFTGTTVGTSGADFELEGFGTVTAVDLPGTYSLAARSPEERVAIDAVLGRSKRGAPELLLVIVDAPRLERSLYLTLQLLELKVPMVVAVNLMDEARSVGRVPDTDALQRLLGVPVVPIVARSGEGLDDLSQAISAQLHNPAPVPGAPHAWSQALATDADEVGAALVGELRHLADADPDRARALGMWALLSAEDGAGELALDPAVPAAITASVRMRARQSGRDLTAEIVGERFAWIDARTPMLFRGQPDTGDTWSDRLDRVVMHPIAGLVVFTLIMSLVFQALFAWSDPLISLIDDGFSALGDVVRGPFAGTIAGDLLADGIIGGVGAILVFVPQIALLFAFLAVLEDCGYLARAAQLMDRLLRAAGLPGKAFVPLLSGFACAVPAIMATRTMPRFRDRLLTMMVVPLTSCSARLPVYALIIAAVFPPSIDGWPLPLRPTVLFAMYLFSTAVTVLAAVVLGRLILDEPPSSALIELPPYRWPHWPTVGRTVRARVGDFIREAGGIILVATIVLWGLLYFPRYEPQDVLEPAVVAAAVERGDDLAQLAQPIALERSYGGRLGKAIEPVIAPLGFDWQMGVGLIGAFAAREVFVSTMGVVYGIGDDVDEESLDLRQKIAAAKRPDGTPVYTPLVGMSLMVFFALAMQCTSTLAVLRKETGGWAWPSFIFAYMTGLAWVAAFIVYQCGIFLGFG